MKNKLTLRNVLVCCATLLAILVFIFSFLTSFRVSAGTNWIEYKGIVWGTGKYADQAGNVTVLDPKAAAVALPLVGAILTLVGGLCACVMAFFGEKLIKDAKVRKIVLFVAGGLMVLGGVFCFIYKDAFINALVVRGGYNSFTALETAWKFAVGATTYTTSCALPIISGILAIVGGVAIVCSQFVNDKKLGK